MSRAADLAWCAVSSPILLPLHALITMAIWLEAACVQDTAPVFFRQQRLGRNRRPFSILKFRTLLGSKPGGRPTRVGGWLRRTGLDEIPQWLNVLRGDMSWIGPRPLTASDIVRLGWDRPPHDPRFRLKPGMTGLAQLLAGTSSAWTRGVDRVYRARRGMRLNAWIIFWSVACCVIGKTRGRRFLRRFGGSVAPGRAKLVHAQEVIRRFSTTCV